MVMVTWARKWVHLRWCRILCAWHAVSCLSLMKMHSQWRWLCGKIVFCSWKLALSNDVIVLPVCCSFRGNRGGITFRAYLDYISFICFQWMSFISSVNWLFTFFVCVEGNLQLKYNAQCFFLLLVTNIDNPKVREHNFAFSFSLQLGNLVVMLQYKLNSYLFRFPFKLTLIPALHSVYTINWR